MRKIEQEMLEAISQGRNWSKDSTQVTNGDNGLLEVYLYGHLIASLGGRGVNLSVNKQVLAQYPTTTTKSRLRALGANVYTKKGVTYLDGVAI